MHFLFGLPFVCLTLYLVCCLGDLPFVWFGLLFWLICPLSAGLGCMWLGFWFLRIRSFIGLQFGLSFGWIHKVYNLVCCLVGFVRSTIWFVFFLRDLPFGWSD